jgi:hypothetical protein
MKKLMSISNASKLVIIGLLVLGFRAVLDFLGLTPYLIAFWLGAVWMITTTAILILIYLYMNGTTGYEFFHYPVLIF